MATTEKKARAVGEHVDRDEWLLERARTGLGSSELPIILGADPFGRSEADLQRKKLAAIDDGRLIDQPDSDTLLRGRLFEDDAVELWQMRAERGRQTEPAAMRVHPDAPVLSSADRRALPTPDFPEAPLEVKAPHYWTYKKIEAGGLQDYMNVQGQVHSLVHGARGTEWAIFRSDPLGILAFYLEADEGFHEIILERAEAWWIRHIVEREPAPEIPTGEPLVDLTKLPKVEGEIVQLDDEKDRRFLAAMAEAYEYRQEANDLYSEFVDRVKEGRLPVGVFETERARLYHKVIEPSPRTKIKDEELGRLVDPAKLQDALVRFLGDFPGIEDHDVLDMLRRLGDHIRVDVSEYKRSRKGYQQVRIYPKQVEAGI